MSQPPGSPGPGTGVVAQWADRRIGAIITNLPSRAPVLFFWVTLVVAVTVLAEVFRPIVVLPALAVLVALTWRAVPVPVPVSADALRGALWALGLAAGWVLVNVWFASEVLLVQRDAGFLTLEGIWLSQNADPDIPVRTAAEVAAQVPGVSVISDAFWRDGDVMYAQGAKTFPGLLALGGWLAGLRGVLTVNLLIGALGLLAVYDLGRRLSTPRWGLLPVVTLAVCTPFIYFSRTPFTEPTNIVVTFGGLVVLWGAVTRTELWRYALGAAMVGSSALSRIDGAAVSVGLIAGLGLVAAGTHDRRLRRSRTVGFLVGSAAATAMVVLGYLDVALHSEGYLEDHAYLYRPLVAMLGVAFIGSLVLIGVTWPQRVTDWIAAHGRALGLAAASGLVLVSVVLASRPLWMQRRGIIPDTPQVDFIASFQRAAGVVVDGTRSYDEMTVTWLIWYFGPVTVAAAVAGAALLTRRSVESRRPELALLLVTLGVPALLYLVRPSITPDQIWAMRRFLPAVIPALVVFAGWFLYWALSTARRRWVRRTTWAAVGLMVVAPMVTWGVLIVSIEYGGRVDQIAAVCRHVEAKKVVAVRGVDPPLLPTLRIMCDADVIEVPSLASRSELAAIREAWGGEVLVASYSPGVMPWPAGEPATLEMAMTRWPHSLYPSFGPVDFDSAVWLGTIEADGSVSPVEPTAP